MKVRCSWSHCEACFEGPVPDGWKLVARHKNTGDQVVVCSDHGEELLQADLRVLLRLFETPGSVRPAPKAASTPVLAFEEDVEVTKRLPKGMVEPR